MQVDDSLAPGPLMQIIYVLRHHCQLLNMLGERCNSKVRVIRLRLENLPPATPVPSPAETWIGSIGFGGRRLGRVEPLLQAYQRITMSRNTAFCSNASDGKNSGTLGFSQALSDSTDCHGGGGSENRYPSLPT